MESIQSKIGRVNETLRPLIADSRLALKGERGFGVEMVRALSAVIGEMDPIMSNARELRIEHPEIARDLDAYVEQATDLKSLLDQLRMMLLARKAQIDKDRSHMETVSRWAKTFQTTR
ncbi:MAG TPA: hypothetical protein VKT53_08910 [Candidatus Acidoferrum sp.]|nr:hypothetical protein [Candidatus Acidoferrum sp.]